MASLDENYATITPTRFGFEAVIGSRSGWIAFDRCYLWAFTARGIERKAARAIRRLDAECRRRDASYEFPRVKEAGRGWTRWSGEG